MAGRDSVADSENQSPSRRGLPILLGPLLASLVFVFPPDGLSSEAVRVLFVTIWTATWWVTEAIPIPATSLLPALLLPTLGITTAADAAKYYSHWLLLLLLGGFIVARGIEASGLHRRIALGILGRVGESRRALVFGFLFASAFLSMGISNTATTLMLLPIGLSVVQTVERDGDAAGSPSPFAMALLLAIAYGANVGGIGTLIGTPPNLIFANAVEELQMSHPEIALSVTPDFVSWLLIGTPVVLIFIPIIGLLLTRVLFRLPAGGQTELTDLLDRERREQGRISTRERRVLAVFVLVAALWVFRGSSAMPGWIDLLIALGWFEAETASGFLRDSSVAILGALLMFIIPREKGSSQGLVNWDEVQTVPWGVLLLLGGGFAIAGEFSNSGLSDAIGGAMAEWSDGPQALLIGSISLATAFLTEITSNTASTNMLMPILSSAAVAGELPPLVLLLPAVLSVSFAFMLPVATAPNAIVFATGRIPIMAMVRCGLVLNIIGPMVVLFVIFAIVGPIFGLG